eukprot:364707-Chlamydomonas_euryale.AAC.10
MPGFSSGGSRCVRRGRAPHWLRPHAYPSPACPSPQCLPLMHKRCFGTLAHRARRGRSPGKSLQGCKAH